MLKLCLFLCLFIVNLFLLNVFGIHGFTLGDVVRVDDALRMKKTSTIFLVRVAWTFLGPGRPFFTHSFDTLFVSWVWKDMADSSIVTIFLRSTNECRRRSAKKSPLEATLSSFCSEDNSLGTQRADFFTRPKSSLRMA